MSGSQAQATAHVAETVVTGIGLYALGVANVPAWLGGEVDPELVAAPGAGLDRRVKRRASAIARALSEVTHEAVVQSQADLGVAPIVFGSALGEATTMIDLLEQMWRERVQPSPMKFALSVHNAAAGMVSISAKNKGFATSVAADYDTPAMALYEAIGLVAAEGQAAVVTVGDDDAPADLVADGEVFRQLAAALVVEPADSAQGTPLARLRGPFLVGDEATLPAAEVDPLLARNPCVGLLDLVDAIARGQEGLVRLDRGRGRGWAVAVTPAPR